MADVGKANLLIVPKFDGLSSAVDAEMDKLNASGAQRGAAFGKSYSGGLIKSGAVVGAFATITNKALTSISSHVGDAVSRFDTLNNYPKVMETMGYSTEAAEASINKMSDRLQGLPTTLDSMVGSTQRLVTTTKDLDKATSGALAVNDMLIAGGANQQLVNAAQEQFMQIISKGKPEMQDWKSLLQAMPGQLDQLAKSLLGPKAGADELYAALGGGKNEQKITMSELLDQVIKLDVEGGKGFKSFREQAETAAGGVATSAANMGNAITRGVTGTMDAIGKENIAGVFNDMKSGINDAFKGINGAVKDAMPVLEGGYSVLKKYGPMLVGGAAAMGVFMSGTNKAVGAIGNLTSRMDRYKKAMSAAGKGTATDGQAISSMIGNINATSVMAEIAVGSLAATVTMAIGAYQQYKANEENAEKATSGFSDAVSRVSGLEEYAGKIDGIGESAKGSGKSLEEMYASMATHVDKMNEISKGAEEQIAALDSAQDTIQKYIGQTDLSAEAQGELTYALKTVNDEFGTSISKSDVMKGKYKDQDGKVKDLTSSLEDLISTKRKEIEMDALSQELTEAYAARKEAAEAYANIEEEANRAGLEAQQQTLANYGSMEDANQAYSAAYNEVVQKAKDAYDNAKKGCADIEEQITDVEKAASKSGDAFDKWGRGAGDMFKALMRDGTTMKGLKDDLRSLGASAKDLSGLSEYELEPLARAYDGTAASIVDALQVMGVGIDDAKAKTAMAASEIASSLHDMGAESTLDDMSIGVTDFSNKMAQAGLDSTALKDMTSENLAELAEACGNDVNQMVFLLQHYNDTPLLDKDGKVQVNDASLIDAEGNVYKWNGTELLDKNNQVVTDTKQLQDAQGNMVEWNGKELKKQEGSVDIDPGELQSTLDKMSTWNNTTLKTVTGRVSITRTERSGGKEGERHNAKGGYRFHADGAIATRATPLDIVGEDGAEAIVPLTNKRYSQPFVDLLAEGLKERQGPQIVKKYYWNNMQVEDGTRMNRAMKAVAREADLLKRAGA